MFMTQDFFREKGKFIWFLPIPRESARESTQRGKGVNWLPWKGLFSPLEMTQSHTDFEITPCILIKWEKYAEFGRNGITDHMHLFWITKYELNLHWL